MRIHRQNSNSSSTVAVVGMQHENGCDMDFNMRPFRLMGRFCSCSSSSCASSKNDARWFAGNDNSEGVMGMGNRGAE